MQSKSNIPTEPNQTVRAKSGNKIVLELHERELNSILSEFFNDFDGPFAAEEIRQLYSAFLDSEEAFNLERVKRLSHSATVIMIFLTRLGAAWTYVKRESPSNYGLFSKEGGDE